MSSEAPTDGARSTDARPLGDVLGEPQQLHALFERAARLATIQHELRAYLNQPWANALRVVNLRGFTLAVHADHAGAATALRHRQEETIAALNRRLGLQLNRMELKVRPPPRLGAS